MSGVSGPAKAGHDARAGELRFLEPAVLARIGTLELRARTIVEGFLSGLHRSPFRGFSVEFAEYRQYIAGDDISSIDWKVYARSDRYYVKKFEEDTNLDCHVLLDVSASMGYASQGLSKLEYASMLAAALAYLMNRQRDAVGLTAFDERIVNMLPPGSRPGHLHQVLLALARLTLGTGTNVAKPLQVLADGIAKRGMIVLISDLLDDPDAVIDGIRPFRFRGTDVIVFHVLDRDELTFPFERATRFRDIEGSEEVMAVPAVVRAEYLAELNRTIERFRREFGSIGIDYRLLDTSEPLESALMAYLATRARSR
jgi:uncharacterized protein (DUF58 family)